MAHKYESLSHELNARGYLTLNKMAQFLKNHYPLIAVSYPVLQRKVKSGELPSIRIGKVYRISREAIMHYVHDQAPEQTREEVVLKVPASDLDPEPTEIKQGNSSNDVYE